MNSQYPPFYVGQKVVCIHNSSNGYVSVSEGQQYVIKGVYYTPCCKKWWVDVGIIDPESNSGVFLCTCNKQTPTPFIGKVSCNAGLFRAITDDFQAITFEKVVEEELVSMN